MDSLRIPELLKGRWENALIMTYGVDATFFENALWRQFGTRCRNKIILADGTHYLEACANYAHSGLIRSMNIRYIVEGIFCPQAAHAKLILLTNAKQGRLLVGSGNLSMQGYASGGELFTQYEYSEEDATYLSAFLSVRDFVNSLLEDNLVHGTARRYIKRLLESTPWIYQHNKAVSPVRHNLHISFFDQLSEAIDGETIEELWVLSPFYDKKLKALRHLLSTWQPKQTTLLMQPSSTSIDSKALQEVLDEENGRCQVRAFSKGGDNRYIHAKMYLLKLADRAICLHGSPNLSQVAMLRTVPQGNIELANLLTGSRDEFDYILDTLTIEPATLELETLDLSFAGDKADNQDDKETTTYQLVSGEWHNNHLYLHYQDYLPALTDAMLNIAERLVAFAMVNQHGHQLILNIAAEADELLKKPVPVRLQWGKDEDAVQSNAVFVCNRDILDATIEATDDDEKLAHVGQLDIEDDEIEQLLGELENALILDHQDIWQVAGRTPPPIFNDSDDDSVPLSYEGIDYDVIRQHPRVQQYMERGRGGTMHYARSRLQIILSAITNHFRGLLDVSEQTTTSDNLLDIIEESDAQTEEEREQEEEAHQRRKQSNRQRIQRIFKSFVKRYLKGIYSHKFQEFVGYEVMTQNYIVFSHLLWKLFDRDWLEHRYLVETQLEIWRFFWGDGQQEGYYDQLELESQTSAMQIVHEYHGVAQVLAGLFYDGRLAHKEHWHETELEIRDFWQVLLVQMPFTLTTDILETTWIIVADLIAYEPPRPTAIVTELKRLANLETENSFLRTIEQKYGLGGCVFNHKTKVGDFEGNVTCLEIQRFDQTPNANLAQLILSEWVRYERRDYYRISFVSNDQKLRVLRFNTIRQDGFFVNQETGEDVEFKAAIPIRKPQDDLLYEVTRLANEVDAHLTLAHLEQVDA